MVGSNAQQMVIMHNGFRWIIGSVDNLLRQIATLIVITIFVCEQR